MKDEVVPHKYEFEKKNMDLTLKCIDKAAELGLLGIGVPEEYGGMGQSFNTSMLVTDKISGDCGSFATTYGAHTGIGTLPIVLYGNKD